MIVRSRVALWWFAVVPATLFGHVLAYALGGRPVIDAQHAYLAPLLEISLVVLTAVVGASLASALMRTRGLTLTTTGTTGHLVARLLPLQSLLYVALERAEGNLPTLIGLLAQLFAACLAAAVLIAVVRLLARCERAADEAATFITRDRTARASCFVTRSSTTPAFALAVRAGSSRLQRPPPLR